MSFNYYDEYHTNTLNCRQVIVFNKSQESLKTGLETWSWDAGLSLPPKVALGLVPGSQGSLVLPLLMDIIPVLFPSLPDLCRNTLPRHQ